ncbi:MAG: class I SAM-dependent methyltransferase [Pseudomonadota bacterium]
MAEPSSATCPICEGEARHRITARDHLYGNPGTWDLYRCVDCGHGFQHPLPPDDAALSRFYPEQYYAFAPPATDLTPRGLRRRGIWLLMHRLKRTAGYDHLPIRGDRLLSAAAAKVLPRRPLDMDAPRFRPGGRLLDFGCGSGEHVARMAFLGWTAEGIEIDDAAAAAGRSAGLDIATGSSEILAARPGRYDEIRSSHSLEHVVDPRGFMEAAFTALRPGGRIAVDLPNGDAASFERYGPYWLYLTLPVHVHIFSPGSLARLVRDAGFGDVRVNSYSPWKAQARSARLRRLGPAAADGAVLDGPVTRRDRLAALPGRIAAAARLKGDCLVMTARRPA